MKYAMTIAALAGLSSVAIAGLPTTVADFGLIATTADASGTIPAFGTDIFWVSFSVDGSETYLDITTSFGSGFVDTEIGLFDAAGFFLDTDDDDGFGVNSTLTYGSGSGITMGDIFELDGAGDADGSDGAMLAAGTYYVAFGGFDTSFSDGFGASSTYFDFDDAPITVSIFSNNVPTPASASLLALGGLIASRRRRA